MPSDLVINDCKCPWGNDLGKILESGVLSDVTLRIENEEIQAHKLVLTCRSAVFSAMFANNMLESQNHEVVLSDIELPIAKLMIHYMYTGKIGAVSTDTVLKLYAAADKYMLVHLKENCREALLKYLYPDILCEVASLADLYSDDILMENSVKLLSKNFTIVLNSEKWKQFSESNSSLSLEFLRKAVLYTAFKWKEPSDLCKRVDNMQSELKTTAGKRWR